ncbi:helix-turn-helix domain-containing protein, partial [Pseudomonas protegens]|uniref:helix-turn-helix domain-containing protein n=1 Tax=Pseudomonas protegens TaxID=380021 RepID=UPI0020FFF6BD
MNPTEFRNTHSFPIKRCAGLLRRNWRGHSVCSCFVVFVRGDFWSNIYLSQVSAVKKMLIAEGVGSRLREERERLGLSQSDFGALVGVSRGTQKNYEV